jgi:hypothetical protein
MSEQQQQQQQQDGQLQTGAHIAADGKLRFAPQFYVTLARHCINQARESFFQELGKPEAEVGLVFADVHDGDETYLPVGFLTYHVNMFLDYLSDNQFMEQLVKQCNEDIALNIVMKPMDALIGESLPRIVRAFRVTLLEQVEAILNDTEEKLLAEGAEEIKARDVVVKNRGWLVAAIENVPLNFSQQSEQPEQEEIQAPEAKEPKRAKTKRKPKQIAEPEEAEVSEA